MENIRENTGSWKCCYIVDDNDIIAIVKDIPPKGNIGDGNRYFNSQRVQTNIIAVPYLDT